MKSTLEFSFPSLKADIKPFFLSIPTASSSSTFWAFHPCEEAHHEDFQPGAHRIPRRPLNAEREVRLMKHKNAPMVGRNSISGLKKDPKMATCSLCHILPTWQIGVSLSKSQVYPADTS